jgi:hypothetical protein
MSVEAPVTVPPAPRPRAPWRAFAPPAAIVAITCLVIYVWQGVGWLSLPGLAFAALLGAAAALAVAAFAPWLLVVLAPAMLPLERVWIVFPWELVYLALAALVVLHALRARPAWALRLEGVELANLLLVGWAAFSFFWSAETVDWSLGLRRLLGGVIGLWLGLRLARWVRRPVFEAGLAAAALSLTLAALARRQASGLSESELRIDRASATDLGWGTANAIATILLVLSPVLLEIGLRSRQRWLRVAAWPALALTALYQVVNASRAAAVLFIGGVIAQSLGRSTRRRLGWVLGLVAALTGLLMSPLGEGLLMRFTNLRDLGSMVVRIWYLRAAWLRTLENLPWGIGLGQGLTYADHLQSIDPHNYWLVLSSELGLPGVLLWIGVLVVLWRRLARLARTPGWEGIGLALQVAFWLSQLHTLVEPTFQGIQYQFLYFWVMGGYLGYHAVAMERAAAGAPSSSSR